MNSVKFLAQVNDHLTCQQTLLWLCQTPPPALCLIQCVYIQMTRCSFAVWGSPLTDSVVWCATPTKSSCVSQPWRHEVSVKAWTRHVCASEYCCSCVWVVGGGLEIKCFLSGRIYYVWLTDVDMLKYLIKLQEIGILFQRLINSNRQHAIFHRIYCEDLLNGAKKPDGEWQVTKFMAQLQTHSAAWAELPVCTETCMWRFYTDFTPYCVCAPYCVRVCMCRGVQGCQTHNGSGM